MTKFVRRHFQFLTVLLFSGSLRINAAVDFNSQILPILSDHCFQCHGPDEKARKAELRLDTMEGAFRARQGKTVIESRNSGGSELYRRISTHEPDDQMPPPEAKRPLTTPQIELIRLWIDQGAPWGEYWSFEKLRAPILPKLQKFSPAARNPIDLFVLSRLEKEGLAPSAEAGRETLIRRVTLDLTGLAPTIFEVQEFLNDSSPLAYEQLVDRLLASPAFGERMAWPWLEAARYADSNGYQGDSDRTMWPWRDWVIEAFNRNLPYDQFTIWQLAGDLLPDPTREQKLATGFLRNHMINGEGGRIPEENRVEYVMDMAETTGTVWLGLTLNCCRCHDHKYDPLAQRDYYSFNAFFNQTPVTGAGGDPQSPPNLEFLTREQSDWLKESEPLIMNRAADLDELEKNSLPKQITTESGELASPSEKILELLKTPAIKRNADQLTELEKAYGKSGPEYVVAVASLRELLQKKEATNRAIVRVMVMEDLLKPRATFILDKGLYDKPLGEVPPAVPAKFAPLPPGAPRNRLGLAEWLVSPDNPLTARVAINNFWQQFFGVGLVKTPENFGVQGEMPLQLELLNWLASEFERTGWDVKQLCRLIVTSATYRQTSKISPQLLELDPQNQLLARGPRFRMPSWMLRDQALSASGILLRRSGGPPVKTYQPPGVWEEATFGAKKYVPQTGAALYQRSIYTFWRRIIGPTMFFDTASRQFCSVKPQRTNTPLHSLATLNDLTYIEAARIMAEEVILSGPRTPAERIAAIFRRTLARAPSPNESAVLEASVETLRNEFARKPDQAAEFLQAGETKHLANLDPAECAAYAALCLAVLNLDETLTKE